MDKNIEDNRLIEAKNGDEAALAALIAKYMPMIRKYSVTLTMPGLDFDDAVQEGYIGLFHAVKTYDEFKGASFTTYATTCIRNAIFSAARSAGRKKHSPLNGYVPLSDNATVLGPEEVTIIKEQYTQAITDINTKLSSFEKSALLLSIYGESYSEIATKLGKSPKAVDNALSRVRQKIRRN